MKEREQTLRIGEVAQQTGMTVEALRYYERKGLLPHPPRSAGGLRRYRSDVLDRVRFIKQAQTLGLSLKEIQQLTGRYPSEESWCVSARARRARPTHRRYRPARSLTPRPSQDVERIPNDV
jgi:MerR family mercuric resistance operon transcriptional regulator